ncbi:uncharacterized protein LOC144457694 [Phascolarctos cinereus]
MVDIVFATQKLQEKFQKNRGLYITFVDLTKAFHTVSYEDLWKIMVKLGYLEKFVSIIFQFHDGMLAQILDEGGYSHVFSITNRMKQDCVLVLRLFRTICSVMLSDVFNKDKNDIKISLCTDGKLFNLKRLQAKTKVEG